MRLRRSDVTKQGFTRLRSGRGFRYLDHEGRPINGEHRERIKALAIPPAWREVWICPWPNGHIQAVGLDDAGRRQYLYHDEWRRQRDEQKYDRVLTLVPHLPDFRRAIAQDLDGSGFSRTKVLAIALRMLDHGVFRTGGEEYAEQNGTHGVATLLREHVRTSRGGAVSFDYVAKGGIDRTLTLVDGPLATAVSRLRRARSETDRLLVYRVGRTWREVRASDVNERFQELVGSDYSVKDLRTWNANVLAAAALAGEPEPTSKRASRRAEAAMFREVAEHLGNTPAVAKKSYVDPRVVELYERGVTIAPALRELGSADLSQGKIRGSVERAVHTLLTDPASFS
jgi:DNA topoisomerase IB